MMPSAKELSYFIEVSSSLNLSRAAERLGIRQPTLTVAMRSLEDCVGAPLLIRSKKGVSLTQAGKQLAAHARLLLQNWDRVRNQTLASMNAVTGSYTLGCHPSVALYSLPLFLADLLKQHPELEIRLQHDLSRKITESVIRLETDIGIVVNPISHPDLVIKKLCDDVVGFWVGREPAEGVLICDPELAQTRSLLQQHSGAYSRILSSSSLEVIARLTAGGAGTGILPAKVAGSHQLARVPNTPVYHDNICVVYRVENRSVQAIGAIVQVIADAFGTRTPQRTHAADDVQSHEAFRFAESPLYP